jgi:hypothetical protein
LSNSYVIGMLSLCSFELLCHTVVIGCSRAAALAS